jgi:carotenoid cleavage dioxygenase
MSQNAPELPFYLKGNFAPVTQEVNAFNLSVEGAIPPELRGLYLRNGPNPRGGDPGHWFFGDGMIHGVRLEDGEAKWYRNRWVRTKRFEDPSVELIGADGTVDRTVAVANTNVIGHAGRIFALVETSFPTEVDPELDTIAMCDFEGKLKSAMTAHPKICPTTGELHFFGYGFLPPYLTYHRLDAAGNLVQSEVIDVPGPTMMHDFAITERHVIFMDLPVVFDLRGAARGMPYAWSDDYGARLGVMPRGGGNADVRWLEIEPCYVFHPFNAYEQNGSIVLDVARYPDLWRGGSATFQVARPHRFVLDLKSEKVAEQPLDDLAIEFPRVDDRLGGLANRYGYAVINTRDDGRGLRLTGLVKYDLATGKSEVHDFGPGRQPGEGVFVPASANAGEEDGYVLAFVYDAARDGSDFVVLDASRFSAPPIATVPLPQRVPFGFHGNWVPDPA